MKWPIALGLVAGVYAAAVPAHFGAPNTIHACVSQDQKTCGIAGANHIVAPHARCADDEVPVHWSPGGPVYVFLTGRCEHQGSPLPSAPSKSF